MKINLGGELNEQMVEWLRQLRRPDRYRSPFRQHFQFPKSPSENIPKRMENEYCRGTLTIKCKVMASVLPPAATQDSSIRFTAGRISEENLWKHKTQSCEYYTPIHIRYEAIKSSSHNGECIVKDILDIAKRNGWKILRSNAKLQFNSNELAQICLIGWYDKFTTISHWLSCAIWMPHFDVDGIARHYAGEIEFWMADWACGMTFDGVDVTFSRIFIVYRETRWDLETRRLCQGNSHDILISNGEKFSMKNYVIFSS